MRAGKTSGCHCLFTVILCSVNGVKDRLQLSPYFVNSDLPFICTFNLPVFIIGRWTHLLSAVWKNVIKIFHCVHKRCCVSLLLTMLLMIKSIYSQPFPFWKFGLLGLFRLVVVFLCWFLVKSGLLEICIIFQSDWKLCIVKNQFSSFFIYFRKLIKYLVSFWFANTVPGGYLIQGAEKVHTHTAISWLNG